jgi:hypothetical protein
MRPTAIKAFSVGVMTGCLLIVGAVEAKADTDSVVYAYAATFAGAVCATLDDFPSFDGINGTAAAIVQDGLTDYQAGQVIGLSIVEVCPRHTRLMVAYVKTFGDVGAMA